MSSRCYVIATVLVVVLAHAGFAQPPEKETPLSQILGDWQARQGLVKTARYVVTGTTEYKDLPLPPGDPVRPLRYVLLFDFEHNRFRQESADDYPSGENRKQYTTLIHTAAYDGKSLQSLYHRAANHVQEDSPDLGIDKGDLGRGSGFNANLWPVFFAHGLVATVHANLRPDKLSMAYDPDDFETRGRQTFNGRNCTVVRTEQRSGAMAPFYDEIWIDQNQKGAIYRYVNFSGTNPWIRLDVQWKQTDLGWWPTNWTHTWSDQGHVQRIHRLRIDSSEPNVAVADSDFTFRVEPGMRVRVSENPAAGSGLNPSVAATKTYLISPSGAWQETSAKGFTTLDGKVLPPERGQAWLWWVAAAAAGVGTLAFAYYFVRRYRRRTA